MRVIAGSARGTRLKAPKGTSVRPTADRVKEALFNIIGPRVIDSCFIDLYAGSGAIGIEALSRGAAHCIFIDHNKNNLALIKENLVKTKLADNARLIFSDALKAVNLLSLEKLKADLVYLDPPYNMFDIAPVVFTVMNKQVISGNGLMIIEHAFSDQQWTENFEDFRQKKYGDTCLTFIAPAGLVE